MSLPTGPLGWWRSIVGSTWRAFMVLGGAVIVAGGLRFHRGDYADRSWSEIAAEGGGALAIMFVASFITSLVYHWQVRRNHTWPGGGGRRNP